ncbi:hypothetical protein KK083_25415 [Fulvivirgaceae bacterium PWU4]|uniref:Uncharacterized protein n=1 Tax=Chryseosolibacter histidini TaxID=2782349 RepID=A0AAP2GS23_9BACT|nr:hypothetical protein [Chryseosolibacter histidini]MBT1700252.1 hypothetical protein [Chryseosolibacter histidini]
MALPASLPLEIQPLKASQSGDVSSAEERAVNDRFYLQSLVTEDRFYDQPAAFYYKDQVRFCFTATPEFAAHFILIKGLVEFHRSRHLQFTFDLNKKQFEADLAVTHVGALHQLLEVVYSEVLREIRFKAALKKAILFEERYRQACAEVYTFS